MSTNNEPSKIDNGQGDTVAPVPQPAPTKGWVHFDEDNNPQGNKSEAAVINTESVEVTLERSISSSLPENGNNSVQNTKPLRTIELPIATVAPIRQGFTNGDIIVTLLPVNTKFPWITPAKFRPELVPEELMAQGLTLTVEEYVQTMELLVNDVRFTLYNVCYKRVLVVWISVAFLVLFSLLFSGLTGLTLFGLGIGWLVLNAVVIVFSMWIKFKLTRNLERCMAHVNKQFLRHKIIIALDDRGKISCHKVNLCFIYMDSAQCIQRLQSSIEQQERDSSNGWEQRMDISSDDIVIQGSRTTRLSRKQERSTLLYLRYVSRWAREVVRGNLISPPTNGGRHCPSLQCPCQFIEEHLHCKPPGLPCMSCINLAGTSTRNIHADLPIIPVHIV